MLFSLRVGISSEMCYLRILGFVGISWERIFFNNWLCVHVLDGSEIIRCRSHRLVVSHLSCIGGSKWWLHAL